MKTKFGVLVFDTLGKPRELNYHKYKPRELHYHTYYTICIIRVSILSSAFGQDKLPTTTHPKRTALLRSFLPGDDERLQPSTPPSHTAYTMGGARFRGLLVAVAACGQAIRDFRSFSNRLACVSPPLPYSPLW